MSGPKEEAESRPVQGQAVSKDHRIDWVDVLRGIGVFYVVFAHLAPALPIVKHIYSFHMFLFFFLSGYLYRKREERTTEIIVQKVKTLFVPFLFWNTLSAVCGYLFWGDGKTEILQGFFMIHGKKSWNAPIWFLYILFLTEVLFLLYDRYICALFSESSVLQLVLPGICLYLTYRIRSNIHLKLGIVPIAFLYYWFGYVARRSGLVERMRRSVGPWIFVLAAVNLVSSQLNIRISVINCRYGLLWLCYIAGISGILLYVLLSGFVTGTPSAPLFRYLGQHSMILMCTQYFVFRIASDVSLKYTGTDLWQLRSTFKALIMAAVTMCLIIAAAELLKRLLPKRINELIGVR